MAIHGVDPKCYILALFVRDDKQRFLLGDDPFEFKDKQLHFQPNVVANDVVEVQGNDGVLLAGQVRRAGTQEFDGYVGNGTTSKAEVEVKRREFLQFFRKNHFYKVIYVFPDGSAIQRKQGFLVDDPTVEELYQQYPDYHVALNFQDVNYYTYSEDDEGEEIYSEEAIIKLVGGGATGGLIWDSYGVVWEEPWNDEAEAEGTEIQINNNNPAKARIDLENVYGDTDQQTYSGAQLVKKDGLATPSTDTSFWTSFTQLTQTSKSNGWTTLARSVTSGFSNFQTSTSSVDYVVGQTYTAIVEVENCSITAGSLGFVQTTATQDPASSFTVVSGCDSAEGVNCGSWLRGSSTPKYNVYTFVVKSSYTRGLRYFLSSGANAGSLDIRATVIAGDHSSDWQNYCGENWQPYTGGIPAPNPDYPQDVQVVTGRQVVTVSDDGSQSQEYEVNLGKNLFDKDNANTIVGAYPGQTIINSVSGSTATTICYIQCEPNATYTVQKENSGANNRFVAFTTATTPALNTSVLNHIGTIGAEDNNAEYTITTPANAHFLGIFFAAPSGATTPSAAEIMATIQIEKGSTATSYAPYFTPIELCKIDATSHVYQDYIYKSGGDWFIHKEVGREVIDGTENLYKSGANNNNSFYWSKTSQSGGQDKFAGLDTTLIQQIGAGIDYVFPFYCNRFMRKSTNEVIYTSTIGAGFNRPSEGNVNFRFGFGLGSSINDTTKLYTWLATNPLDVYYPLISSSWTDTQITNAALIAQLDALDSSWLFIGQNNILVSASSPNLPAPIKFSYMTKYTPLGAEWEEGGTKGPTIVDVNAIDNTYPVWELTGPSVNPTISVITTNTTLTYVGTITASQKLEIDMLNKTATLNGTSVIGNVSGDWVYMAPGTNRISYTAGNTDAPDSTLYWQEVVG